MAALHQRQVGYSLLSFLIHEGKDFGKVVKKR